MTQASLIVSLPQMVDLALGSPEVGSVNFNILNVVLQVMIQQMKLTECTVDFRGPEHERVQALITAAKPGLSLKLTEVDRKIATAVAAAAAAAGGRGSEEDLGYSKDAPAIKKKKLRQKTETDTEEETHRPSNKMVVVEPNDENEDAEMPTVSFSLSEDIFNEFQSDIVYLKKKMTELLEIPTNNALIDAVRAQGDKTTPVSDMWQIITLNKRVDAAETGVNKLASMFEDCLRDAGAAKEQGSSIRGSVFAEIVGRIELVEQRIEEVSTQPRKAGEGGAEEIDTGDLLDEVKNLKEQVKNLESEIAKLLSSTKGKNVNELLTYIEDMKEKNEGEVGPPVKEVAEKFTSMDDKLNNLDETYNKHITDLSTHLLDIEKELGELLEKVNTAADDGGAENSVGELFNNLMKMQEELEEVAKTANKCALDQGERQIVMDAMSEQIEVLKTTKANREDLEDALAEKADTQHMNRKVSHDQFDAACDDITRSIEETMNKLTQQELMWTTTLEEIQQTIGVKLDRTEFDPLRDFVNKKIKSLQQRLKALLAMKNEQEAAGTKSKLKDVNCISCDKDVVMYKDNKFSTLPQPPTMPGSRSIKPYITYELDAVRKQQRHIPHGTNMNYLETAVQQESKKKAPAAETKQTAAAHLCNRYCGGSHTVTTPHQRVAHIGHFLNQWGPTAVPLDEGTVIGTNGQSYKAREGPETPRSPRKVEPTGVTQEVQTEEPRENVQRMSYSLEPTGLSKQSLTQARKASKEKTTPRTSILKKSEKELPTIEEKPEKDEPERRKSAASATKKTSSKRMSMSARSEGSATKQGSRQSVRSKQSVRKSTDATGSQEVVPPADTDAAPVEATEAEQPPAEEAPPAEAPAEETPAET